MTEKAIYLARSATISGYPAVQIGRTGSEDYEDALIGRRGQVRYFEKSNRFHAFVTVQGNRQVMKHLPHLYKKVKGGGEVVYYFDLVDLPAMLRAIAYTSRRPTQARLANNWK